MLIPGAIDTLSSYVEHPQLVAERIIRYANVVGRENVIAGTDCGCATFADFTPVNPEIAWAKLHALVEGVALASEQLATSAAVGERVRVGIPTD